MLRSRSCHLYGGAEADFLVGRNRELAPAGFSFRKTKLKSFVLVINMKSVLFKKTNMMPKRFLLITKFIRAKKKLCQEPESAPGPRTSGAAQKSGGSAILLVYIMNLGPTYDDN